MKISGDGIHFDRLAELKKFADDFSMNGWIGTSLPPGEYPKCSLENRLVEMDKELNGKSFREKGV